jgi:thiamine-phosphate pyrophosphorylase
MPDRPLAELLRLTLVIGKADAARHGLERTILAALRGGVTALQLREKTLPDREFYEEALLCRRIASERGALFIVNNRVDIALASGADGVHVGESDLPLEAARGLLPKGMVLGFSASSREGGEEAARKGADYLGVGAVYPSPSKPESEVMAPKAVAGIVGLGIPTVGIGGISPGNAGEAWAMGFTGLAVISAICGAGDPEAAARGLLRGKA